ncbi:hypothetical protein [Crocinitomix algicola]|uniref:hypothetical protein n=1 Tax=Crocinitomix algicola TaxID=1740263 RepID=UPI001C300B0F|nr:hypothetical protein [Crocinitomix algicola]
MAILVLFMMTACKTDDYKGKIVAKVGDEELYSSELLMLSYSTKDSAKVVSNYINEWIEKQALIQAAKNEKSIDQEKIAKKVKQYEDDLYIHELENVRIEQQLDQNVSDADIETYYKAHEDDFQLNDYLVKVLYLKIPLDAPDIENIGAAYKLRKESDLETIDTYAKTYASNFYYDMDSWIYFDDLLKEIPLNDINKDRFILKRSKIRFEENGFYYFLNIVDYKLKNTLSPISFERENIRERILNSRVKTLREKIKEDIIQHAYEAQKIERY